MTPIGQWKRLDRVMVECTVHMFITHCPNVTLQLHNFDFFRTCRIQVVSALLRGSWQDFNWHDSSRGPSAIAELLVTFDQPPYISSKWATVHLTLAVFMYSGVLKEGHWVMPPTEVQYFLKKIKPSLLSACCIHRDRPLHYVIYEPEAILFANGLDLLSPILFHYNDVRT